MEHRSFAVKENHRPAEKCSRLYTLLPDADIRDAFGKPLLSPDDGERKRDPSIGSLFYLSSDGNRYKI